MSLCTSDEFKTDSEVLIKEKGAEKLRIPGDIFVFIPSNSKSIPLRIRGSYVSPEEINAATSYLKEVNAPQKERE